MFNQSGGRGYDTRRVFSGKDTLVLDASTGEILATATQFQAQVSFNNTQYQPLGSANSTEHITGFSVTIALTQAVICDDRFIRGVFEFFESHRHSPIFNISSVIFGYDGSQSRMVFLDCVPSSNWDLHNFSVGDLVNRQLNFHVNQPPILQSALTYR